MTGLMAPGYLDLSVGMTYTSPNGKFPHKVSLNPLSTNGTLVFSDKVKKYYEAQNATSYFGVDIDKHLLFSGGSSINISFDRFWGQEQLAAVRDQCLCILRLDDQPRLCRQDQGLQELPHRARGVGQCRFARGGRNPPAVPNIVALHPTVEWRNTFTVRATNSRKPRYM